MFVVVVVVDFFPSTYHFYRDRLLFQTGISLHPDFHYCDAELYTW